MEEKSLSTPLKQWPNRPKFPFVHGLKTNQKLAHQLACRCLKIAWALKSSTISTFFKANFGGIPSFETSQILQVALLRQWHGNFKMASAPECTVHRALCFFGCICCMGIVTKVVTSRKVAGCSDFSWCLSSHQWQILASQVAESPQVTKNVYENICFYEDWNQQLASLFVAHAGRKCSMNTLGSRVWRQLATHIQISWISAWQKWRCFQRNYPQWNLHVPWKSMVGRCISYWSSPFKGYVSFREGTPKNPAWILWERTPGGFGARAHGPTALNLFFWKYCFIFPIWKLSPGIGTSAGTSRV